MECSLWSGCGKKTSPGSRFVSFVCAPHGRRTAGLVTYSLRAAKEPHGACTSRRGRCTIYASRIRECNRLPAEEDRRSGTAPVSPKATILIVDDEPDVREVLEEYFVAHGYAVIGAESASAAKAMAAEHAIDLALVDIHMPGEDGLSLARHLRERYATIAIVMLTSAGDGRRSDRGPRDGRRRLRPQALRPARAAGPRQERAAAHVGCRTRRPRRRNGCASAAACSTSPRIG